MACPAKRPGNSGGKMGVQPRVKSEEAGDGDGDGDGGGTLWDEPGRLRMQRQFLLS